MGEARTPMTQPQTLPNPAAGFLQGLPLLAGLPAEVLADVASHACRLQVPAGKIVMEEGSLGDGLYLLVDGQLEVTRREGNCEVVLAVVGSGAFLGEMSLIEQGPRSASVRTVRDSELLVIGPADFEALIEQSPSTALTLLRTVIARLRSTEASLVQHGKLASLGTLAAGLAHELNNPASALGRGLPRLREAWAELERSAAELGRLGLWSRLEIEMRRRGIAVPAPTAAVPAGLGAIEAEDRLLDFLEARGVEHAARAAPPLAAAGWTPERLDDLLGDLGPSHASAALHWLAARCDALALIEELARSTGAISDIVAAVKAHSALGQSAAHEVDVVRGVESALVVLRYKLGEGITIVRDFAPHLPRVESYGAELNHVWANLIENALDAMQGRGTLRLDAVPIRDGIAVRVTDDGPGIPDGIRARVFDPFFTTKPLGVGTGLGLHIAYHAVNRHGGTIRVESRPGRTTFTVELPLRVRSGG
jgi:signal transduction histidine kinase